MADGPMDATDSYVGSKRRSTSDSEQEDETLLHSHLSSDITTPHRHQEETAMDAGSPKKKAKCFSLLSEGNQELGLSSSTENASLSGSFEEQKKVDVKIKEGPFGVQDFDNLVNNAIEVDTDSVIEADKKEHPGTCSLSGSFQEEKKDGVKSKEGSFGVQDVDNLVNNAIEVDMESVTEADKKEHPGTSLEFEGKRDNIGKALECENVLEAEKKRLLSELEVGKLFGAKTSTGNISGLATNSTKIDEDKFIAGVQGPDLAVRGSLKIGVIDDTVLIESFPVSKTGNGSVKDEKNKGKKETDGKKSKRSRRKGKNEKIVLGEAEGHMVSTRNLQVQNGRKGGYSHSKIMYSRKELEALRFVKVGEQRKFWRDVYNGLGAAVIKEYGDLGSWKHQKNMALSSNPDRFGRKAESPAIMSVVAGRGTRNGEDYSENVDNDLEYMEDNKTENINSLDLTSTDNFGVEDTVIDVEEECTEDAIIDEEEEYIEDDDSDEDYTSILRRAFMVEGEPDFDSGPPEDGLEYLRRVRWEAAQIPKVKIAKPDRNKPNKEQSVYMPQIPEIAQCPEHLLPLKQWEEAFLADFSELRLTLSCQEDPSANVSFKLPRLDVQENLCQVPESVVVEKFNDLSTREAHSDQTSPSNIEGGVILPSHQNPSAKTSVSNTGGDYPTLSAIRKLDSVARVSMLRKRISSIENMGSLSRSNCMWLFALCAAVDTPLDGDTCASLRGLLRKCASLRAGKSEVDDEVIMLNILATISGRYFGQSEN
ncbi:Survival motor neuron interacting protein 1 [Corchorus capsularis]|uniref:Survival motor neuron interacting protein 1 n=1 Tax=Corchorus capsularis TaxID=210143 RepID=A0A1R3IXA6_COCAP|nr:Survival motor neuron interacting protein 1 [Corchorus capsularis]